MRLSSLLALFLLLPIVSASARNSDSFYIERRGDLCLVAYCSEHSLLPNDSYRFFKTGKDEVFGPRPEMSDGERQERKRRAGIAYLRGEEQTIEDMAADDDVDVAEVCGQYELHISLGKIVASRRAKGSLPLSDPPSRRPPSAPRQT